jgi:hypothetical protein
LGCPHNPETVVQFPSGSFAPRNLGFVRPADPGQRGPSQPIFIV